MCFRIEEQSTIVKRRKVDSVTVLYDIGNFILFISLTRVKFLYPILSKLMQMICLKFSIQREVNQRMFFFFFFINTILLRYAGNVKLKVNQSEILHK